MYKKLNKGIVNKIIDTIVGNFKQSEEEINNLNVFPVPDGDTGTNMLLTLKSINDEVKKLNSYSIKNISESISFGALMGARGNSGVILSQILKGFFDIVEQYDDFDLNVLQDALLSSKEMAYNSVQDPTEGTILTTIKDIQQLVDDMSNGNEIDFASLMDNIIEETEKSVTRTTYLLPVLKQADVVDAGAKGLLVIIQGFRQALEELDIIKGRLSKKLVKIKSKGNDNADNNPSEHEYKNLSELNVSSDIKYAYCTELIIKGRNINIERLREKIESYGDSAMVVGNYKVAKIHVHTNHPHKVLGRALREGELHEVQINNMVEQSNQAKILEAKEKESGLKEKTSIIAVANGEGITEIFKSIGCDFVVNGGQTMNPSTYDLVKAINSIDADRVIIMPNNKNIIPTAKQAKRIVKKELIVISSETVLQGISAMLSFNPDLDIEENTYNMNEALKTVKSGEVTTAVRDANLLVGEIKKGEFIGLYDGKVRVISDNAVDATVDLVRDMIDGQEEVLTFYTGRESKKEETEQIRSRINKEFPKIEVEFHNGGQPLYPYIFSIE